MSGDVERLRIRSSGRVVLFRHGDGPGDGTARFVGRVTTVAPVIGKFMLVIPVGVLGSESEGAVASFTDLGTDPVPVLLLGPGTPAVGDHVVVRMVPHRWVARKSALISSGATGTLLGCLCSTPPATLTMTVAPSGCGAGLLNDCTIQYGPTPSSLSSAQIGVNSYLSTTLFPDPPTGYDFYYYFSCFSTFMRLSQAFPESVFGSPWVSSAIYTWKLGDPGNTCSPFLLSNGRLTAAGGSSCVVTLTG